MCIKLFCKFLCRSWKLQLYDMKWPILKFPRVNGNSINLTLSIWIRVWSSFFSSSLITQLEKTERVKIRTFKMTQSWFFSDVINDISAVELYKGPYHWQKVAMQKQNLDEPAWTFNMKNLLTSSNSTTALGHSLSFLVSCPPWSWPMYPGGAPIIFAT